MSDAVYFKKILDKLKLDRNLDFSNYRENLLMRRIMARVRAVRCNDLKGYYEYLTEHNDELDPLLDVMTINVTEFFRDEKVFDIIEKRVLPELILAKESTNNHSLRLWSCACASGEEAYSMLMIVAEYFGLSLDRFRLEIFGTDIDDSSLSGAREGVYELSAFKDLPPERLNLIKKYMHDMGNRRYWIREEWPAYVNFLYHDIVTDSPLEHMDMILCRNLFIYFNNILQRKVLEKLYDSLNDGGFLILGNVESPGTALKDKFEEYDRHARIYRKI